MTKLYWVNKCKDNNFRCPNCQNMIGDKSGQMPKSSKNHRVQIFDGQVKCVVCGATVGYFAHHANVLDTHIRQGMTDKVLATLGYVTAIEQDE